MSYGNLILDDNGLPLPQAIDNDTLNPTPLWSKDKGLLIKDIDAPPDGVQKIRLIGKDNKEIASSEAGLAISLADPTINTFVNNGEEWIPNGVGKVQRIIPLNSYSGTNNYSEPIYNNGARNAILILSELSATYVSSIGIQIKVKEEYFDYKSFDVVGTTGSMIITFGLDDITNKCIVPSMFRVVVKTNTTSAMTYKADIQLV